MYIVKENFADIQDNRHVYRAGDKFPRDGVTVSEERFAELSSDKNRRGIPLIEKLNEKAEAVEAPKTEKVEEAKEVTTEQPKPRNRARNNGQKKASENNNSQTPRKPRGKKQNAD